MNVRSDDYYMVRAIALAETALGRTSPNPTVGCVIVKDDEVVGEGYHPGPGQPHAEVFALNAAGDDAREATAYITLEPCSTHGKTPPCVDALVQAGLSAVVYGTIDPNPAHGGKGIQALQAAGVACRCVGEEALLRELNRGFFSWMERGRPYATAKIATTVDGRMTLEKGKRTQLSGEAAREWVHRWRALSDAVLVGIDTVLVDDPLLTARPPEGCSVQPTRVVLDSSGRLPASSHLVQTARRVPLLVVTTDASSTAWRDEMAADGVEVAVVGASQADGATAARGAPTALRGQGSTPTSHVDLIAAFQLLGERGMLEIAVEPGPTLLGALVAGRLVEKLHWIVTAQVGAQANVPPWYEGILDVRSAELGAPAQLARDIAGKEPWTAVAEQWPIENMQRLGKDILLTLLVRAVGSAQA